MFCNLVNWTAHKKTCRVSCECKSWSVDKFSGACSENPKMFCPPNDTIQQLTEKTKLLAQKCSQQMRVTSTSTADVSDSSTFGAPKQQQVATFRSYIAEVEHDGEQTRIDFPADSPSPINCLTVNLASLNRIIKNRCSFVSTTSYTFGTFPRKKPKRATAKWFIKVSL